jgi:hypothetical protein
MATGIAQKASTAKDEQAKFIIYFLWFPAATTFFHSSMTAAGEPDISVSI